MKQHDFILKQQLQRPAFVHPRASRWRWRCTCDAHGAGTVVEDAFSQISDHLWEVQHMRKEDT